MASEVVFIDVRGCCGGVSRSRKSGAALKNVALCGLIFLDGSYVFARDIFRFCIL